MKIDNLTFKILKEGETYKGLGKYIQPHNLDPDLGVDSYSFLFEDGSIHIYSDKHVRSVLARL